MTTDYRLTRLRTPSTLPSVLPLNSRLSTLNSALRPPPLVLRLPLRSAPEPEAAQTTSAIAGTQLGPSRDQVGDPVTDPVTRILRVLADGALSPATIQQQLGIKHRPTFRKNYLRPALAQGLLEMTLPDKPSSRLQKYRTTDAGRARLAQNT